jgi:threonine/homoserine/homoserine lactone efflux protein
MSTQVLLAFAATCVLLGLTPGPNMALIIANTASHGLRAGLATLSGVATGLVLLVTAAAAGMTSVVVFMAAWFDVLRWVGACYLAWLGFQQLRSWWRNRSLPDVPAVPPGSRGKWYLQGLGISLSNPKVLFFLGAFLPQFVDASGDVAGQLAVLSVLFVVILTAVDLASTFMVAGARERFSAARMRVLDGVSGVLLLVGGAALAMMRRP